MALLCALLSLLAFSKPSDAAGLNFLVVGDWGGQSDSPYTTPAQEAVAKAMGKEATAVSSQFVLSMGDNFYDSGVKDVDDSRFKKTFEDVFKASALQSPWYVVCGNHDHYGNCSAEIAYSKVSNRWNFPDYYYTKEFTIPGSKASVAILFIDTIILAGAIQLLPEEEELPALPPSGPASPRDAEQEWDFINQTLSKWAQSTDQHKWKIVAGHYPVWSVGKHGPTQVLVEKLKPQLERAGVTAYFCGHDHNMQHLNDSGVQYYLMGAGHLIDPKKDHEDDVPAGSLKYFYGPDKHKHHKGAFAAVSATDKEFTVTYYSYKGEKLYSATSTTT